MTKKPSKELFCIAYHEAGHAVAAYSLEIPLYRATIVPNEADGSVGHVLYGRLTRGEIEALQAGSYFLTPGRRVKIEYRIIATFAGGIAEQRYRGRRNLVGASSDRSSIVAYLSSLAGNEAELSAYAAWLEQRAITLIDVRWDIVEAIAAALLEHHTLTGAAIREAIYQHADDQLKQATAARASTA